MIWNEKRWEERGGEGKGRWYDLIFVLNFMINLIHIWHVFGKYCKFEFTYQMCTTRGDHNSLTRLWWVLCCDVYCVCVPLQIIYKCFYLIKSKYNITNTTTTTTTTQILFKQKMPPAMKTKNCVFMVCVCT